MADDTTTPQDDPTPAAPPDPDPAKGSDNLGDAGKKALDAERREKRAAEKRATELEAQLKELQDRDKTDAERQAERLSKAEAEIAQVPAKVADALKSHLVVLHEISDDDAELFLTASDPELLLKQVTRLIERNTEAAHEAGRPRPPKPDPNQGRTPTGVPLDPRAADLAQIEADLKASSRR